MSTPPMFPPFVNTDWLDTHRDDVLLVDSRWYLDGSSAADAYAAGHIPGAAYIDFDRWLSGPATGNGLNPFPDPHVFAEGMGSVGISNDTTVVAYDDAGGVIAARLVWMLRTIGTEAALLDGGLQVWKGALQTDAVAYPTATFHPHSWPETSLVDLTDLNTVGLLVDARNADRFDGSTQAPTDPRSGHIPGAVNVPCRNNLTPDGHLKDRAVLRDTFATAGIDDADTVVSYCGSGVTACHNLLTMEWAGLGQGRLYVGGWSEYGAQRGLGTGPVEGRVQPAQ